MDRKCVFNFKDDKIVPDIIHDYSPTIIDGHVPLIIDNGTYKCRAGWAVNDQPSLIFKNLIAKQRGKKNQNEVEMLIGNDITNLEVVKWVLRSQFDRNIVTMFDTQEQIFDHLFSHLGINTDGFVDHPVVLTEALCNPNYNRQLMSELLFECYRIPEVVYGVDSMFSFYHNHPSPESADGLLIDFGYQATHVVPVLDGCLVPQHCRRINIGGGYVDVFLQRLLQLKYPNHTNAISLARSEEIVRDHCFVATSYRDSLKKWEDLTFAVNNVIKMQLPLSQTTTNQLSSEQQKERRKQQMSRLQEVNTKRREEKLKTDEAELNKLMEVHQMIINGEDEDFLSRLSKVGLTRVEDLQSSIDKLSASIHRAKAKILGLEPPPLESEPKEQTFPLLDIPDEMLTPDQQAVKKRQRILKNAQEGRNRALALQREKRKQEFEDDRKLAERRQVDFSGWLAEVKSKRQNILDARASRRQKKADMAKRRTFASQQRMRIISQLAAQPSKKGDSFGMDDSDWDVYKEINREGGTSDSEAEDEKLEELETMLKEHDPEFQKELDVGGLSGAEIDPAEFYRLHLGIERFRVPELLFQPSMLGLEQAGVAETVEFILGQMDSKLRNRVVQNVFVTGGCGNLSHLPQRFDRELKEMLPFGSSYKISKADNPSLDAWYGARKFSLSPHFKSAGISRQNYQECGEGYLKEHLCSNRYFSSPVLEAAER